MKRGSSLLLLLSALGSSACSDDSVPAPGAGGVTEHFYVVNTRSENLSVIEGERVIDTIQLSAQPHGQGPSSRGDRIYVTTDGDASGEVIAIDPRTRRILWRLPTGG